MTGQKRCCATCRFLQDMELSGNGWCTHPNRKLSRDVRILVRKGELACRNSWGGDLWADATHPADVVDADEPLVAKAPSSKRDGKPDQMWLPDAPTAAITDQVADEFPVEDIRLNDAAVLEQEDRAESLRLSPRDAINRARVRSSERKHGKPAAPIVVNSTTDNSTEPGTEDLVANLESTPAPSEIPEPDDMEIHRDLVRESFPVLAQSSAEGRSRLVTPPVPVSEVAARPHHTDEDKYYDIPEIQSDVELPRLRNQFGPPRQRDSSPRLPEPTLVAKAKDESEVSSYDRVLQRAQEYRSSQASPDADPVLDRVTSSFTPTPNNPNPQPIEPEDEVVDFRAERLPLGVRFAAPVEFVDDIDETNLEDDYELERSFRPEETANQSGHRWWHTIGRHRVFKPSAEQKVASTESYDPPSTDEDEFEAPSDLAPTRDRDETTAFSIDWDDSALAPVARPNSEFPLRSTSGHSWASLDYLDDVQPSDEPLQPLTWSEPATSISAALSRFDAPLPTGQQFDPSSREGMEHLRDRLYGASQPADSLPPIQSRRPITRPFAEQQVVSPAPRPEKIESVKIPNRFAPENREAPVETVRDYDYDSEFNPDFDLRRIAAAEIEPPLDMRIEISPEIPRKCATCKNFRAADNGPRGWCTNKWAFAHRPLVDSEDLACDSTIGCWWLPENAEWDTDGFLARLRIPTPRTDALVASLEQPRQKMTS